MPCFASGWRFCRNPFTDADSDAGYRYDLSVLQTESSLTHDLDAPGPSPPPPAPTSQACGSPTIVAMPCSPRCWFFAAPERLHQHEPAHPHCRAARTGLGHVVRRADDLRPAPAETRDLIVRIEGTHRYSSHGLDTVNSSPGSTTGPCAPADRTRHPDNHSRPPVIGRHSRTSPPLVPSSAQRNSWRETSSKQT